MPPLDLWPEPVELDQLIARVERFSRFPAPISPEEFEDSLCSLGVLPAPISSAMVALALRARAQRPVPYELVTVLVSEQCDKASVPARIVRKGDLVPAFIGLAGFTGRTIDVGVRLYGAVPPVDGPYRLPPRVELAIANGDVLPLGVQLGGLLEHSDNAGKIEFEGTPCDLRREVVGRYQMQFVVLPPITP
jgi:hypothetical protein